MSSPASAYLLALGSDRRHPEQRSPERRHVARLERELHRVAHGELGKEPRRLERATQPVAARAGAPSCGSRRARGAAPCPCGHVAADRVEQRRLAGAVVPDEPDHLAGHGVEVDVVDRDEPAEAHGEVLGGEHRAVGVASTRFERDRVASSDAGGAVTVLRACRRAPSACRPSAAASRARSTRSARSRPGCRAG